MTLYSNGCPQCSVLEAKLNSKNVMYQICSDMNIITEVAEKNNIMSLPFLITDDGDILPFAKAVTYVNNL